MTEPEDRRTVEVVESYRSVMAAGRRALRGAFILNGGAAVGLLALVADKGWEGKEAIMKEFLFLALWLGYGAAAAVVAAGCVYHAQGLYHDALSSRYEALTTEDGETSQEHFAKFTRKISQGHMLNWASWFFGWFSVIVFLVILHVAYLNLSALFAPIQSQPQQPPAIPAL